MDNNKRTKLQLMEMMLRHSAYNVPQPLPLVEKKAEERLSADDFIAWKQIVKEWNHVSEEGKKEISKLMILNSYDMIDCTNISKEFVKECQDTPDFVREHPEYEKKVDDDSIIKDMMEFFEIS